MQNFHISFAILGAAFLAVTGGEAMYADMGHFGRLPIRLAWFAICLPALVLNYFGQAALLVDDPSAIDNPFFQLAPDWLHYPLVALSAIATVIASQAIISGVFSLTQQAIQLGFLPRMHIEHTTSHAIGQIYVPLVNWLLAAATLGAVLGFGTSDALAGAYGIAVSLLMAITTLLAALVAIQWGYSPLLVVAVNGFFFVIDCIFFAANSVKLHEGGWFPLLLAGIIAFLMLTWRSGVKLVERARGKLRQPEEDLIETAVNKCHARLPGTAVFLASTPNGVPLALTQFVKHNRVLHERVLLVTVLIEESPRIADEDRAEMIEIIPGITRVILHYGFMQYPTIYEGLKLACRQGKLPGIDLTDVTYLYRPRDHHPPRGRPGHVGVAGRRCSRSCSATPNATAAFFGVPTRTGRGVRNRDRDLASASFRDGEARTGIRRSRHDLHIVVRRYASPRNDALVPVLAVLAVLADVLDRDDVLVLGGVEHDDALGRAAGDADAFDRAADQLALVGHQHDLVAVLDRE